MLLQTDHAKAATELKAQDIHNLDKIEINQKGQCFVICLQNQRGRYKGK